MDLRIYEDRDAIAEGYRDENGEWTISIRTYHGKVTGIGNTIQEAMSKAIKIEMESCEEALAKTKKLAAVFGAASY